MTSDSWGMHLTDAGSSLAPSQSRWTLHKMAPMEDYCITAEYTCRSHVQTMVRFTGTRHWLKSVLQSTFLSLVFRRAPPADRCQFSHETLSDMAHWWLRVDFLSDIMTKLLLISPSSTFWDKWGSSLSAAWSCSSQILQDKKELCQLCCTSRYNPPKGQNQEDIRLNRNNSSLQNVALSPESGSWSWSVLLSYYWFCSCSSC